MTEPGAGAGRAFGGWVGRCVGVFIHLSLFGVSLRIPRVVLLPDRDTHERSAGVQNAGSGPCVEFGLALQRLSVIGSVIGGRGGGCGCWVWM